MIDPDTQRALDGVAAARSGVDLFGPAGTPRRVAKRTFRRHAARLHPDRAAAVGADPELVAEAFRRLTAFYEQWAAESAAPRGAKTDSSFVVTGSGGGAYTLSPNPVAGSVTAVYLGTAADGTPVAAKIPRAATSNRLMAGERASLGRIATMAAKPGNEWLIPYYPRLLDTAVIGGTGPDRREVNVINHLGRSGGFVDLATVAAAHPGGLDGRDWAWIHRRLLRAVAGAHLAGVVHGAITPDNVLIHPEHHGVVLAGWTLSTVAGRPLPGRIASRAGFYPPDPAEAASPALDIFMAHAVMKAALDPGERRQIGFAAGCMQKSPGMRPAAADLLDEYDALLESLYGGRRFRPFPHTVAPAHAAGG